MAEQTITINDQKYGEFTVTSPILIELIQSPSIQRLKGISQLGLPDRYYHVKGYSRFEHSLGVMRLLLLLGASQEEQIAGLLHDISHTAFSHLIDWVLGNGQVEDLQDNQFSDYLKNSEIPEILVRYGFDTDQISNYDNFKLLERNTPELCADRLDYALRQSPKEVSDICLNAIIAQDDQIVFKNESSALFFGKQFLFLELSQWGAFESVSRYTILSHALNHAMKNDIICFDDCWQDDEFVIKKLLASGDNQIIKCLKLLENKNLDHCPKSDTPSFVKHRVVDPLFLSNNKIVRLSESNENFCQKLKRAEIINKKGIYPVDIIKHLNCYE
ncbi:MAG: HD domain-containing protein [Patescibacteria group bacterium]